MHWWGEAPPRGRIPLVEDKKLFEDAQKIAERVIENFHMITSMFIRYNKGFERVYWDYTKKYYIIDR